MPKFRNFIHENGDLKSTLKNIPNSHRKLLRGYTFDFEKDNTLKGDDGHIGVNDFHSKKITVAAPWYYGREFATLHEIGHSVYSKYVANDKDKLAKWKSIVKNTKGKMKQDAEELFCHAYANTYVKHRVDTHHFPEWEKFIKSLG